jgi:hypothetical protein
MIVGAPLDLFQPVPGMPNGEFHVAKQKDGQRRRHPALFTIQHAPYVNVKGSSYQRYLSGFVWAASRDPLVGRL